MHLTLVRDAEAERREYEYGRSDGFADGAYDARWAAAFTNDKIMAVKDEAAAARLGSGRLTRCYTTGYARGYRDAVQEAKAS